MTPHRQIKKIAGPPRFEHHKHVHTLSAFNYYTRHYTYYRSPKQKHTVELPRRAARADIWGCVGRTDKQIPMLNCMAIRVTHAVLATQHFRPHTLFGYRCKSMTNTAHVRYARMIALKHKAGRTPHRDATEVYDFKSRSFLARGRKIFYSPRRICTICVEIYILVTCDLPSRLSSTIPCKERRWPYCTPSSDSAHAARCCLVAAFLTS